MKAYVSLIIVALFGLAVASSPAQQAKPAPKDSGVKTTTKPAGKSASQPAASSRDITVALLDFAAQSPGTPDLGSQISEVLTAMLSGQPGFSLVDRATLTRTLQEHELNLSGVVSTEKAVEVGKLVGARILVTGRAFPVGNQLFITAKLIGTETSLVEGVLVKSKNPSEVADLLVELAEKVSQRLVEAGPKLVAEDDTGKDPLPALQKKLEGVKKPVVAVIITERHMTGQPSRVPDPAVETEVKLLLKQCGFEIKDVKENDLADWAKLMDKNNIDAWPRGLYDADLIITGEAFSEFAARIGNLVSCAGRAEINIIKRANGKIELADRETSRAVDLSENIAGKKALQKAGRVLGLRTLEHFAKTLGK